MVVGLSHLTVTQIADIGPVWNHEFLDIQATRKCGFPLNRVHDMIRTYSQMHRQDKYLQHSSITFYSFIYLIIYLKLTNLQKYSVHKYIKVARQIG